MGWLCLSAPSKAPLCHTYHLGTIWNATGFGLSKWETMLYCNGVSHRLSPYPEWSLKCMVALGPVSLINRSTMDWLLFIRHTLFIIVMGNVCAGVFCVPPFVCVRLFPCICVPACLSTRLPVCLSLCDRDQPTDHLYIPPTSLPV